MVKEYHVDGYENFKEKVAELSSKEINGKKPRIFVLFSGTRMEDGKSWCPDCVRAEPIIKEAIKKLDDDDIFMRVEVGKLELWKSPKCPFRMDKNIHLVCVPTIMLWGTKIRIEGDDCWYLPLLEILFEEGKQTKEIKETEVDKKVKKKSSSSSSCSVHVEKAKEGSIVEEVKKVNNTNEKVAEKESITSEKEVNKGNNTNEGTEEDKAAKETDDGKDAKKKDKKEKRYSKKDK